MPNDTAYFENHVSKKTKEALEGISNPLEEDRAKELHLKLVEATRQARLAHEQTPLEIPSI